MSDYESHFGERNPQTGRSTWVDGLISDILRGNHGVGSGIYGGNAHFSSDVTSGLNAYKSVDTGNRAHTEADVWDEILSLDEGNANQNYLQFLQLCDKFIGSSLASQNVDASQFVSTTEDQGTWGNAYNGNHCNTRAGNIQQHSYSRPAVLQVADEHDQHIPQPSQFLNTVDEAPQDLHSHYLVDTSTHYDEAVGYDFNHDSVVWQGDAHWPKDTANAYATTAAWDSARSNIVNNTPAPAYRRAQDHRACPPPPSVPFTQDTSAAWNNAGLNVVTNTEAPVYHYAQNPYGYPPATSVPSTHRVRLPQEDAISLTTIAAWDNAGSSNVTDTVTPAYQYAQSHYGYTAASSVPIVRGPVASSSNDYWPQVTDNAHVATAPWVNAGSSIANNTTAPTYESSAASSVPFIQNTVGNGHWPQHNTKAIANTTASVQAGLNNVDNMAAPAPRYAKMRYGRLPVSSVPAHLYNQPSPALSNTTVPSPADSLLSRRSASTQVTTPGLSPLVSFATTINVGAMTQQATAPSTGTGNGQQQAKGKGKGKKLAGKTAKASKPKPKPKNARKTASGVASTSAPAPSTSNAAGSAGSSPVPSSSTFTWSGQLSFAELIVHHPHTEQEYDPFVVSKGFPIRQSHYPNQTQAPK